MDNENIKNSIIADLIFIENKSKSQLLAKKALKIREKIKDLILGYAIVGVDNDDLQVILMKSKTASINKAKALMLQTNKPTVLFEIFSDGIPAKQIDCYEPKSSQVQMT